MIDLQEILARMNPNQKINYDRVMQQMTKAWAREDVRPKILMHVCCAPCSTYTLEYLTQYADITVYFANSDRKSTRLNSSHANISYAVFCLKKKKISPELRPADPSPPDLRRT